MRPKRTQNNNGYTLMQVVIGAGLAAGIVLIAAQVVSSGIKIQKEASLRYAILEEQILIRRHLQGALKSALSGPVYMSQTAANSLGISWFNLTTASAPYGSVGIRLQTILQPTSGVTVDATYPNNFDSIALLAKDNAQVLTLTQDAIYSSTESMNGQSKVFAIQGSTAGYASNDIVAISTAMGTELLQVSGFPSGGSIALRNITGGPSIWFPYLPAGTPIYKVRAIVIGKNSNTEAIQIAKATPTGYTSVSTIPVKVKRFRVELLTNLADPDNSASWAGFPGLTLAPKTTGYSIRIRYESKLGDPNHPRQMEVLTGI